MPPVPMRSSSRYGPIVVGSEASSSAIRIAGYLAERDSSWLRVKAETG